MSFFAKALGWLAGGWIGPLLISGGLVLTLWAGYAYITHSARSEGRAEVQALWDQDTQARALLAAGAAEEKRIKEKQHEMDIASERKQREADGVLVGRALADTRRQLERLRSTTATVAASAVQAGQDHDGRPGADDPASALGAVFAECSGELVEMAEQTEQLGVRLRGLQAWAGSAVGVCGSDAGAMRE